MHEDVRFCTHLWSHKQGVGELTAVWALDPGMHAPDAPEGLHACRHVLKTNVPNEARSGDDLAGPTVHQPLLLAAQGSQRKS